MKKKKESSSLNLPMKCIELILMQAGVIAITDGDARYVYVNDRWVQDTGISKEDALGKYNHELIDGYRALTAIKSKKAVTGDPLVSRIDGKILPGIMTYMPILDEDGKGVVGCFISSSFINVEQAQSFMEKLEYASESLAYLRDEMQKKNGAKYSIDSIYGESDAIKKMRESIYIAGASDSTVLIEGETGTGKELVAHAVHNCSIRRAFPFVKVNCSAIPENLMEAEFFGYEGGSFTGASQEGKRGKFEKAHLGSIFLDEINHLDMFMQPKLLRVLQEKEVERIGSSESLSVDARVIAGTNIPLRELVKEEKFREDLYYRLNIIHIVTPPLRKRREDIPLLIDNLIEQLNEKYVKEISGIEDAAVERLQNMSWPGNVRELHNKIEKTYNIAAGNYITLEDILSTEEEFDVVDAYDAQDIDYNDSVSLTENKGRLEKDMIVKALHKCGGNKTRAAEQLNISRTLLYKKLKKYGL